MRKRVWNVTDFALHAFGRADQRDKTRAKRWLRRLNAKHGGKLLLPHVTGRAPRQHLFLPATLRRLEPDLFAPIEDLEGRLDELEERVGELTADLRRVALACGQVNRTLAAMQERQRGRAA